MNGTNAKAVINSMKAIYACQGILEELVSDQDSKEMQEFHAEWNIFHNTSLPYNSRSNGQVERSVQTLKHSLIKAEEDGYDLYDVLLDYRITPTSGLPSPAELLMGRKLRSTIPANSSKLEPKFDICQATKELERRQRNQKEYANKHTKPLQILKESAKVWFRQKMSEPWKKGTVVKVGPQLRTYGIHSENGAIYPRNRFFIRPDRTQEQD